MASEYASAVHDVALQQYLHAAAFMILYWDHALTFGSELRHVWSHRKTFGMWLFLANRYIAFFGNIPVLVLDFVSLAPERCNQYSYYRQGLMVMNGLTVCALMTMRVYALFNCSRKLLAGLSALFVACTTVVIWALFGQGNSSTTTDQQFDLCCACIAYPMETSIRLAVTWEAQLLYDLTLLSLTIWISVRRSVLSAKRRFSDGRLSLLTLLMRDGAAYFSVMVLGNLANILTYYFASPYLRGSLSVTVSNLAVVVMSRMMLNLCEWADTGLVDSVSTNVASLMFAGSTTRERAWTDCSEDHPGVGLGSSART